MKATFEKIEPIFGNSFTVRQFTESDNRPYWHFHPEYEIVFISNGRGKRHINDHISYFEDGDLIFLGPNLPHFAFTEELLEQHTEVVIQMKADFLGKEFFMRPELAAIRQLFERSEQGLTFTGKTKQIVGEKLLKIMDLDPFDRLLELLAILQLLATAEDYTLLNASGFAVEVSAQDHNRIETIYDYVQKNFQNEVSLDEVAKRVNMTVPAFCRYFKKLTNKTFTEFVNEIRIAHACRQLADEHLSIAAVSFESGFNNLSHFNKQFRLITGVSPRDYRRNIRRMVQG
ncbi:MAG: helix-turn-helix domain-containing protein [Saprospiraceae bacterium]